MDSAGSLTRAGAVNQRIVTWEGGVPVVRNVPIITEGVVAAVQAAAAAQPYVDPDDALAVEMGLPPSRFSGMTNIEVMIVKRTELAAKTGDDDRIERVLDRLVGKPKTKGEIHAVSETYEQFLERTAKGKAPRDVTPESLEGL